MHPVPRGEVSWKSLESGFVLLNLQNGLYYTLNESASAIWGAILEGRSEPEIVAHLLARYDGVDPAQAAADVREQLAWLQGENLIEQAVAS